MTEHLDRLKEAREVRFVLDLLINYERGWVRLTVRGSDTKQDIMWHLGKARLILLQLGIEIGLDLDDSGEAVFYRSRTPLHLQRRDHNGI